MIYGKVRHLPYLADHVGIEQIAHQNSTGSNASSGIGGKSSSSGDSVANTANRDLGGAGSMVKPCLSPAVTGKKRCRMHGGAPGSGAPRGNKNALKHGRNTREAIEQRRQLRALLRRSLMLIQKIE